MGYVNLGYSKLDVKYGEVEPLEGDSTSSYFSIDQQTGKYTPTPNLVWGQAAGFTGGLDLGGNAVENVKAIMSASGNWRIEEDGKLVVQELEVKGRGITLYAADGNPYCVKVEIGGAVISVPGKCNE